MSPLISFAVPGFRQHWPANFGQRGGAWYDGDTDITLANIAGGAEYKAGKADSVSGLKVIDPLTPSSAVSGEPSLKVRPGRNLMV
jgi:hypothetical protein